MEEIFSTNSLDNDNVEDHYSSEEGNIHKNTSENNDLIIEKSDVKNDKCKTSRKKGLLNILYPLFKLESKANASLLRFPSYILCFHLFIHLLIFFSNNMFSQSRRV
jgi:hypothetical protein